MFVVPFNYRGGLDSGDPIPTFGTAKAIFWVNSQKGIFNGFPYSAATIGNTDVRYWQDQTPYANHLSAATATSPSFSATTFSPSGSSASFPYIEVNDVHSEYMYANSSPSLLGISSGFTVFIVMRKNPTRIWSCGNPIIEFNSDWAGSSEGFGIDADCTPSIMELWYENVSINPTSVSIPWGSNGVDINKFYYYTFRMSAGTMTGYVGSTLKNTSIASGGSKNMKPVTAGTKLTIGGGFNGSTFAQSSPIDVAEVIIYDGAVPNSGLPSVWNYFKTKYGFTG
jgi:hypothetical protein